MPIHEAQSLRELLTIREANRSLLSRRPGYLGSAVGFKYSESRRSLVERDASGQRQFIPAILLFVDRKLATTEESDFLPETLSAGPVSCATDVVVGHPRPEGNSPISLDPEDGVLRRALREEGTGAFGSMPLSSITGLGTAACLVASRSDPTSTGLLTADHVAGAPGTVIERPPPRSTRLGLTEAGIREVSAEQHLGSAFLEDTVFRLDAAFVRLAPGVPSFPGVAGLEFQGDPLPLDLESFDLLGDKVESIGPIRGRQFGQVVGFGYEWNLGSPRRMTDWLIVGDGGKIFAEPGDSGKLVVRVTDRRPVALLWGGRPLVHSGSGHQETWCYASHLHSVLESLDLRLTFSGNDTSQQPPRPPTEPYYESV